MAPRPSPIAEFKFQKRTLDQLDEDTAMTDGSVNTKNVEMSSLSNKQKPLIGGRFEDLRPQDIKSNSW